MSETTNRLIHETSPYLRQHAHNPVDWYPWGDEAFARARAENKPILLSIGYSACHWCHVMERESFEDPATARLMNDLFVNIKVDREERPDVDHIYMSAVQMLTGRGGWPMTMFLKPDGTPYYGGTYFPPDDRHGLPAFRRVLMGMAAAWRDKRDEVDKTATQILDGLAQADAASPDEAEIGPSLVREAANRLSRAYDDVHGGIGQAPKFPNEAVFDLFLRAYDATNEPHFLHMVRHTLKSMAEGGIYDQLGGGFHRYSVDERWLVPHFEKMLYDNALLVPLYLSAFQVTGEASFATVARQTLDYVIREMRHPEGGFFSTQDADSEGEEGRFFVWEPTEVRELLGTETAELVSRFWDISEAGNFEDRNILHPTLEIPALARMFGRPEDEVRETIEAARATLFAAREKRVKPGLDDKVLTSWNALMIRAFARAAEVLDEPRYAEVALQAVAFLEARVTAGDRLQSTWKDGVARFNGYLDDYAFLVAALVDVFEMSQDRQHLQRARQFADALLRHFWDHANGGFFFTSDDHEALIVRSKPAFDGSIPSGNSVACHALLRLAVLTGEQKYERPGEAILSLWAGSMKQQPFGFANLLCAADFYTREPHEVVIVADGGVADAGAAALLRCVRQQYLPNRSLTVVDPLRGEELPAALAGKGMLDGRATAYVCRQRTCSAPVTTPEELAKLLR